MPTEDQIIAAIARDHLNFETLETRNSDHLDFREVPLWGVSQALRVAYRAGKAAPSDKDATLLEARNIVEEIPDRLREQLQSIVSNATVTIDNALGSITEAFDEYDGMYDLHTLLHDVTLAEGAKS